MLQEKSQFLLELRRAILQKGVVPRQLLLFSVVLALCMVDHIMTMTLSFRSTVAQSLRTDRELLPLDVVNQTSHIHLNSRMHDSPPMDQVILIIIDGLRFDEFVANENFQALLRSPQAVHFARSQAIVPSISIPNWISLVTGATADIHNVIGNDWMTEVPIDSIFHQAARANRSRALTGASIVCIALFFI